jgi:hypothetical protein
MSGILDRCTKTNTCPKIVHTMSDIEYREASGRGDTTDPLGTYDLKLPSNVRIYQFSGNQHGGFSPVAPLPTSPDSRYSRLDHRSLVPLDQVKFPQIRDVTGPAGIFNTCFAYFRGPQYDTEDLAGIIAVEPPIPLAEYPSLVLQVDADGNDIDGLRSHIL